MTTTTKTTTETRKFTNDLDIPAFVLVVHGDDHDFIGAACDSWEEADERASDFEPLFCDIEEVEPGDTLDLDYVAGVWFGDPRDCEDDSEEE